MNQLLVLAPTAPPVLLAVNHAHQPSVHLALPITDYSILNA